MFAIAILMTSNLKNKWLKGSAFDGEQLNEECIMNSEHAVQPVDQKIYSKL